jgi:hypothetical protein
MDKFIDRRMDGIDGWMDGWVNDKCMNLWMNI